MTARAIWQGTLKLKNHEVGVKLYSALEDRQIHFHLLHRRDRTRVQQRMVDAETEKPVPLGEARKAFEAERGVYVVVTGEDIERGAPTPSREVNVSHFVPLGAIDPQSYERPYYLGPAEQTTTDYFALAKALERKKRAGIASWVMRKHSYVGALLARQGYLMLVTLRHAEEVIPVTQLEAPQAAALESKEKALAGQLIEALSGEFQPEAYHDEFQRRVQELIDAKRRGMKFRAGPARRTPRQGSLADSLQRSLKEVHHTHLT